ncbi:MAG: NCS1 family nucleobase:cation symporter-1 [Tannerellaceae bacterium]|nr:NCS1 family nucleobase:cation symporter-1 [Tannerellaceae bacterium]
MKSQIEEKGIVVLTNEAMERIRTSPLWNEDFRPCTQDEHSWGAGTFASLWIGMCVCVPSYTMASGFLTLGMNWWQSLITIFLGNVIVLIPLLLNASAGCKFGIPYPMFAKIWFGRQGSHIPTLLRGTVSAGWFGINTWIGATAIDDMLCIVFESWDEEDSHTMIIFFEFLIVNVALGAKGLQSIRSFIKIASPLVGISALGLFIWAISAGHGLGPILSQQGRLTEAGDFFKVFFPCLTVVISFWATVSLNISDFTRYGVSNKAQIRGQAFSLPLTMTAVAFVAICVTSVTIALFGEAIWYPEQLLVKFPKPVIFIGGVVIALSSIMVNVVANLVAPARAMENLYPRRLSFAAGAMATGAVAIVMQPWYILENFNHFVFNILNFFGVLIGPMNGIALTDYWIVRKKRIALQELYNPNGRYNYKAGFNPHAITSLALGMLLPLIGYVLPELSFMSENALMFGMAISGVAYTLLMRKDASLLSVDDYDRITLFR